MAAKILNDIRSKHEGWQTEQGDAYTSCSVGIMAHNEEANIGRTIRAVLQQQGPSVHIKEVLVIASGCTDRTVPTVAEIALQEPRLRLCIQEKREGKASAINLFLKEAISPVVVLIGADVIPEASALEYLCAPFKDPKIGMVGGRPVPVNDPATFMGHAVHLLWRYHSRFSEAAPPYPCWTLASARTAELRSLDDEGGSNSPPAACLPPFYDGYPHTSDVDARHGNA